MAGWNKCGNDTGADQGAHLSEDFHTDREVQEAKLSADMAARVAAVGAVSQLAQMAADQSQLHPSPSAKSDAQHAGAELAFKRSQRTDQKLSAHNSKSISILCMWLIGTNNPLEGFSDGIAGQLTCSLAVDKLDIMICNACAVQLGIALWDRMTTYVLGGENAKDACKLRPGSAALRTRVRAWQALTAMSPFLAPGRIRAAFKLTWRCMEVRALAAPSWHLPFRACAQVARRLLRCHPSDQA